MSDLALFSILTVVCSYTIWCKRRPYLVDDENEELLSSVGVKERTIQNKEELWYRATYVLVMHDPPDMFFEPKEWSHTPILMYKVHDDSNNNNNNNSTMKLALPGGLLVYKESFVHNAADAVKNIMGIDVTQPENSLHHLFTFPYENNSNNNKTLNKKKKKKIWGDFMECVYRGTIEDLQRQKPNTTIVRLSLEEVRDLVLEQHDDSSSVSANHHNNNNDNDNDTSNIDIFTDETQYALRLYFQRQADLRAQRKLMKGYSSMDLEHYKLRSSNTSQRKIIFLDEQGEKRREAVEYTLETDDGMSPRMLLEADIVLLGVSRAGKTPISLILSQSLAIKVANIPLVVDVPPPPQLFKVAPKRVFCLTVDEKQLQIFRKSRIRRELCKSKNSQKKSSTYADITYIRRDLENAKSLAIKYGFTEINVSGRAIEETASLIASKYRERFPDTDHIAF